MVAVNYMAILLPTVPSCGWTVVSISGVVYNYVCIIILLIGTSLSELHMISTTRILEVENTIR